MIAVLALMFLNLLIFNPAFNWPLVFQAMIQSPVIEGFWKGTILVTILAMVFGVTLGVILAVMRLSDNPILKGVSWLYTWFFRAIPRYVLLVDHGPAWTSSSQKASRLVCRSTGRSSNGSV